MDALTNFLHAACWFLTGYNAASMLAEWTFERRFTKNAGVYLLCFLVTLMAATGVR